MKRILVTALVTSCLALSAQGDQITVEELQGICAGKALDTENACRFFILGVVEGASFGKGAKTASGPLCIAPGIQGSELVAAVKSLMQTDLLTYPQDKSLAASGFVVAAAMKTFPCKK